MATSAASRPRAISTRPIRGTLLRGSKVCQRAPQIDFNPRGEIPDAVGRRRPHVAQVAGAIARGNIHAAAKGDGQVSVVAANALALLESLPGGPGGAGIFIVKSDVVVDVIANRLDAVPSRAACGRTVAKPPETADPSRNIGCPAGRPECLRADPSPGAVRAPAIQCVRLTRISEPLRSSSIESGLGAPRCGYTSSRRHRDGL